jgi:hypothetical protein
MTMLAVLGIIVLLSLYTIEERRAKRTNNQRGWLRDPRWPPHTPEEGRERS